MKVGFGAWKTHRDGDRYVCDDCGTVVRGYQYRFYTPDSEMFERCVGYAWCTTCRVFSGTMVHVSRRKKLVDRLANLPAEKQDQLRHNEPELIEYLDRLASG